MHEPLLSQISKTKRRESFNIVLGEESAKTQMRRSEKRIKSDKSWYYLRVFGEIGFSIAIPIAGGAFLGKYIDSLFSTYPKATLILLLGGIAVSFITLFRAVQEILDRTKEH